MSIRWFSLLLILMAPAIYANEAQDRQAATRIIEDIVGKCEIRGMFACEQHFVGAEPVFLLLHLLDNVQEIESGFDEFVRTRYPNEGKATFSVLDASLKLSLKIQFHAKQFVDKIVSVRRVNGGYDVTLQNKDTVAIRKQASQWVLGFSEAKSHELEQLRPFLLAASLKRSILVYRMLEADMAHLSRSQLEANVSEDLAPIVVAVLGKENFPTLVKWLVKDPNEIVAFYRQFKTVDDMKANIRKIHHLSS